MAAIRDARFPEELSLVRGLLQEYADALGVDVCFQRFDDELANLPGAYAAPRGGLWLAEAGGEPAGCIALRPLSAELAEVKRMYVRPAYRGAGLGRALAEHAVSAAARIGYQRVCLDTLPSLVGAIALYRSLGFAEIPPYYDHAPLGAVFFGREVPAERSRGA